MVAGDEEIFVVTQAVHRAALWRHIGIQVDFGATEFACFSGDSVHQGIGIALATEGVLRDQIIDVNVAAPNQIVGEAEATHGNRVFLLGHKHGKQAVARAALDVVQIGRAHV